MKWSKYNYEWTSESGKTMIYSSKTHQLMVAENDQNYRLDKVSKENLLKSEFFVGDDTNEVEELICQIQKQNEDISNLSVWIFVSNDCNLVCPYCWELGGLLCKNSNMSAEISQKTVDWILNRIEEDKVEKLEITYMGGEPCLNIDAITDITLKLNQAMENIDYSIITNGVLLDEELIRKFIHLGIHSYQITIDGTKEVHDKRRVFRNGDGTYQRILRNIMTLASMDNHSNIIIRINVDEENAGNIPTLLHILRRLDFQRFASLCINDTIHSDGIPDVNILHQVILILKLAKKLGFHIAYGELNNCWMMSKSWFMINQDGLLYKCPSLVGKKHSAVGSILEEGYYPEYEFQLAKTPWKKCEDCELLGLCQGGCPNRDQMAMSSKKQRKVCKKQYMKELLKLKYSSEEGDVIE